MHAALRGANALVDSMVDAVVLSDSEGNTAVAPPRWSGLLDLVAKGLLNAATYPGQKNSDGSTAPPFVNPVLSSDPSPVNRMVYSRYLLSWIHPLLGAAQQACKAGGVAKGYTQWAPYIRSLVGAAAFSLGIAVNLEKDNVKQLTASGALESIPGMLSPLALAKINDDTFFIPIAVKLFVDLLCEPIAAYLILAYGPG